MNLFKSKAEKEMEARMAIRNNIRQLEKSKKAMQKKQDEMIKLAQEAKQKGVSQQYAMAVSGLKMIMAYQRRCDAMILQIKMTETMRDLTVMSSKFIKLMGNVGEEVTKVAKTANFAQNQMAFEKGMMASEAAMDQLESFLEDSGMAFEQNGEEVDLDKEIERMIDATTAAQQTEDDEELDRRLAELEKKRAAVKE